MLYKKLNTYLAVSAVIFCGMHSYATSAYAQDSADVNIKITDLDATIEDITFEDEDAEGNDAETNDNVEAPELLESEKLRALFDNLSWKGSLVFTDEQNKSIYQAIIDNQLTHESNGTTAQINQPITSNSIKTTKPKARKPKITKPKTRIEPVIATVSPTIYTLNSILYYKPESWSIWVNGKRIRINQAHSGIVVDSVNEDSVTLITQNVDFDVIKSNTDALLLPIKTSSFDEDLLSNGSFNKPITALTPNEKKAMIARRQRAFSERDYKWKYQSKDGTVLLDSKNGIYKFVLSINQSFNTASFSIYEGKKDKGSSKHSTTTTRVPTTAILQKIPIIDMAPSVIEQPDRNPPAPSSSNINEDDFLDFDF